MQLFSKAKQKIKKSEQKHNINSKNISTHKKKEKKKKHKTTKKE